MLLSAIVKASRHTWVGMLEPGSNASTGSAIMSHVQMESTSQCKVQECHLGSLCVDSNTLPGKVPQKVWMPQILIQIYGLAALNNSQGIAPQRHQGTALVVVQASIQLLVCATELQPLIVQIQCSYVIILVCCLYPQLQDTRCKLSGMSGK